MYYLKLNVENVDLMKKDHIKTEEGFEDGKIATFFCALHANTLREQLNESVKVYPWFKVWKEQQNGYPTHRSSRLKDYEDDWFELKEIKLSDIPSFQFFSLEEYQKAGRVKEVKMIEDLIDSYEQGESVPCIVLDEGLNAIDALLRIAAMRKVGYTHTTAYVRVTYNEASIL